MCVKSLSRVRLFATPWTIAYQAPPSMVFSRQEYWSGLPFPSPEDLPHPGIKPGSPTLYADALPSEPPGKSLWEASNLCVMGCTGVSFTKCQWNARKQVLHFIPYKRRNLVHCLLRCNVWGFLWFRIIEDLFCILSFHTNPLRGQKDKQVLPGPHKKVGTIFFLQSLINLKRLSPS